MRCLPHRKKETREAAAIARLWETNNRCEKICPSLGLATHWLPGSSLVGWLLCCFAQYLDDRHFETRFDLSQPVDLCGKDHDIVVRELTESDNHRAPSGILGRSVYGVPKAGGGAQDGSVTPAHCPITWFSQESDEMLIGATIWLYNVHGISPRLLTKHG